MLVSQLIGFSAGKTATAGLFSPIVGLVSSYILKTSQKKVPV